jgi:hypothetical protein
MPERRLKSREAPCPLLQLGSPQQRAAIELNAASHELCGVVVVSTTGLIEDAVHSRGGLIAASMAARSLCTSLSATVARCNT